MVVIIDNIIGCYLLRDVYSDATQLHSTRRRVVEYRHVLNVVTQLTQFVGHDVIYDVF